MTQPAPSGSPSRRRVAGLALLGVGVIAAIIGLASLALNGGDDGGQTAAPPPSSAAPEPGATPDPEAAPGDQPPPTDPGSVGVPTFSPTPTAGIAAPPGTPGEPGAPGADAAPGGDGSGAAGTGGTGGATAGGTGGGSGDTKTGAPRGSLRVYNNSTITGLASSAAEDFRNAGWQVDEVANYPFGIISSSTVYYRPGTPEKAVADELGSQFGLRVHERFPGLEDASPGVIVIVTNDYRGL